ncbi:MAG: MerR family DNA-binding protein [Burkholderiales bacterium]
MEINAGVGYGEADAEQLRFIKRAQVVGVTLAEIQTLQSLRTRPSCRATRDLAASKLDVVDARIRELRHLRKELARWVADCDANAENSACPVIDRLTSRSNSPAEPSRSLALDPQGG